MRTVLIAEPLNMRIKNRQAHSLRDIDQHPGTKPKRLSYSLNFRNIQMPRKIVTSLDGTEIWAESKGDTSKQALVWVHGVAAGAVYFENVFNDPEYLSRFHMVCHVLY